MIAFLNGSLAPVIDIDPFESASSGLRVIFSPYMEPGIVLKEPTFSRVGKPVFICRSKEDLLSAIDREFWRELGIEDPRE